MEGTVDQTIQETRDQIIEFCRSGRAVKVDGLGTFTPTIDPEGNLAISFRADSAFGYGLNVPGVFTGTILNRENIGTFGQRSTRPQSPIQQAMGDLFSMAVRWRDTNRIAVACV